MPPHAAEELPFVPGYPASAPLLLGRYLPPLTEGIAAHYLDKHTRPGDLVFDPFGQAPAIASEALSLGRRVLVAGFNPITRLALSLAIRPPAAAQLRAALTALADAPAGRASGERLEVVLRRLYATSCSQCDSPVTADAYDWDADTNQPVNKTYVCPNCGPRQVPADDADRRLAARYSRGGLDYHFLLDRVAAIHDPDRAHAEEAMAVYPPRTLAAIGATLIKLEGLRPDAETRRLLAGLLIAALDTATVLSQDRPRVLAVPRRYREVNFWLAMESAVAILAGKPVQPHTLSLSEVLEAQAPAGIHVYTGSARQLAKQLPSGSVRLILTAVPRPNQAYWTLSALWAAWLWGRDSAEALRAVLRRRRYDWAWHARALQRTIRHVAPALRRGGRMVALLPEAEPGFSAAVMAAGAGAGLKPLGAVLRADTAEAQFEWSNLPVVPSLALSDNDVAGAAAVACLVARGEPSRWASLHFAVWHALASRRSATWDADDPMTRYNRALEAAVADTGTFEHLGAAAGSDLATGQWYLRDAASVTAPDALPLADRAEVEVMRLLASGGPLDEVAVQAALCRALPGAATPGRGLVGACLASYGLRLEAGQWQLRAEDAPDTRDAEVHTLAVQLRGLAVRHGYEAMDDKPQIWLSEGQPTYLFVIQASAVISLPLLGQQLRARRRFLVVPGGRAGLVEFKLRRDPRLRLALRDGNWLIIKFRHIRKMIADPNLTRATLEPALGADPLEASHQLALPE
jgi:hypothetical protein